MENRNTIIAIVLMLVVWIGFTILYPPQPPETPPTATLQEQEVSPEPAAPRVVREEPARLPPAIVDSQNATGILVRDIIIENDKFRAVFTNSGGRLKSMELKEYRVSPDPASAPITLVDVGPDRYGSLRLSGSDGMFLPEDALYRVSLKEDSLRLAGTESREVVFSSLTDHGMEVQKIFTFHGDRYDIDLQVRVVNQSGQSMRGNLNLALVQVWDDSMKGRMYEFVGPVTLAGDKVHTDNVDDVAKGPRIYGRDTTWTGFTTKYFLSAIIPQQSAVERVRVEKSNSTVDNILESPFVALTPGESFNLDYNLYFGPRDVEILQNVGHQLSRAIDFGFFSPIAKPLLHVLRFFHTYVGNYGVAIIILTIIIKILFFPLTHKSFTSMKAMQKLQPEMQKIRDKFKSDRERMNREIMELYKTKRVNPLGGCLPMLVQIPVFFALYKVLMDSIELRHAHFALWITDLSAKDPYYITPVIMGASMFLQQKMTPTTMDPMQAKIFMFLPIVFTFLFLNFPSGLVIYWLVNNLLTIAQQFYINKKK
jgi:YidC/Oxa1 family membrane protein insertase